MDVVGKDDSGGEVDTVDPTDDGTELKDEFTGLETDTDEGTGIGLDVVVSLRDECLEDKDTDVEGEDTTGDSVVST